MLIDRRKESFQCPSAGMIRCLKTVNVKFFTHIGHLLNSVKAYADNTGMFH
jgi:hypothetical protein